MQRNGGEASADRRDLDASPAHGVNPFSTKTYRRCCIFKIFSSPIGKIFRSFGVSRPQCFPAALVVFDDQ